jgi:outer membrane protein OmpA-like peptidoglycan-associated protein
MRFQKQPLALAVSLLTTACAGPLAVVPATERTTASRGIGWVQSDWRICDEGIDCPVLSAKTVVLQPRMAVHQKPVQPAEPARPLVADTPERESLTVHFPFGKAVPTRAGYAELTDVVASIKSGDVIRIEGYTDAIGGSAANERLAYRRAQFVARWLKRQGVNNPLEIAGHGKCCYAATNDSEEGRAANRRVVIILKAHRTGR